MKSVLMIAYFFPPEGSAGSYRPLRFVRELSTRGWGTSVITAEPYGFERYDPQLLSFVPSKTEVVRVRACDLWQAIQSWRGRRIQAKLSTASAAMADQIRAAHSGRFRSNVRRTIQTLATCYYQPDMARHWIRPA